MIQRIILIIFFTFSCVPFVFADDSDNQAFKFLTLSDIHFDPFISCYSIKEKPCPLIRKLQNTPANQWSSIFSAMHIEPAQYGQNSNYTLYHSALAATKKAAETEQAKFVLILGDFLGHDYRRYYKRYSLDRSREGYRSFVKKTFVYLTEQLSQTFPTIDVYGVVGNNDSYQGDYYTEINGSFFNDFSYIFSRLIKNKSNRLLMMQQFPKGGYYAVDLPNQKKIRLILLNTVLFSYKAKGRGIDEAANQQLAWLHKELASAKANKQKVLIAMHIPTGVDVYATLRFRLFTLIELWQRKYTERFQSELEQFAPEISAIFAGHLHSDWFQIMTPLGSAYEIPVTGTPSISPIFGNNPGFKVYRYAMPSMQLEDFMTYYFPLKDKKIWSIEYNFNQIYQPNCHDCSVISGMKSLKKTGDLANYYRQFYVVGGNNQPITSKWDPYYWCAIRDVNVSAYKECIETKKSVKGSSLIMLPSWV